MIGVVVVTHSQLGNSLIETAEFILGSKPQNVEPVSINVKKDVDELRAKIATAIKNVDSGAGVFILTDMFGGTPTNISAEFLEDKQIEIVTGVNLPMLLKGISSRQGQAVEDLAVLLKESGRKAVMRPSEML